MGGRVVMRVKSPTPLGDVTIVPAALLGRPEADLARAMAAALAEVQVPSAADVLSRLRRTFPLAPLRARVAALGLLMERGQGTS